MHTGKLIFSQVLDYLPKHTFRQCVDRYQGNRKIKKFSCLDQYLCMAFAQLTYRESLRDIEVCLRAQHSKLYHMGIRGGIARNTLANANKTRDWRIYSYSRFGHRKRKSGGDGPLFGISKVAAGNWLLHFSSFQRPLPSCFPRFSGFCTYLSASLARRQRARVRSLTSWNGCPVASLFIPFAG